MRAWGEQTRRLTGAAGTLRAVPAGTPAGMTPPSWWISDEEATASNMAAMAMMGGVPT